jgi:predicted transposase YdaD
MREVMQRYVRQEDREERAGRLVAILASGLERLLRERLEHNRGLDVPADLSLYVHGRNDPPPEEQKQ